ncbi:hypothetical protein [Oligoflexus tunisiensis]|uniref:hypothetical protein n=1 Tax=Oligoflexus tunisiensis TaxID=708132 RepID=UPI001C40779B|nr:hypothetical protein [Oligoflexus tunisiensis]
MNGVACKVDNIDQKSNLPYIHSNVWIKEESMNATTQRELLSRETRELFALGARLITEDWVKYKVMCDLAGIATLDEALHRSYAKIDWNNRDAILPIIPTLEFIYSKTPNTMIRLPQKLDEALAKDGYRMKNGKLVRLKI